VTEWSQFYHPVTVVISEDENHLSGLFSGLVGENFYRFVVAQLTQKVRTGDRRMGIFLKIPV
jgi:hypothetical protein